MLIFGKNVLYIRAYLWDNLLFLFQNRRIMKLNTLLIAAAFAGTFLTMSCNRTAQEKQLKYTHTTLVDGDAYQIFQIVGAKMPYEVDYATYAEGVASSAQARELAGKVKEVFTDILPNLDELATKNQVDFPIRGAKEFEAPIENQSVVEADSIQTDAAVAPAVVAETYSNEGYVLHVRNELAEIKKQFKRLSRNTNRELRDYAASQLDRLDELYKLAGGQEDEHAHH